MPPENKFFLYAQPPGSDDYNDLMGISIEVIMEARDECEAEQRIKRLRSLTELQLMGEIPKEQVPYPDAIYYSTTEKKLMPEGMYDVFVHMGSRIYGAYAKSGTFDVYAYGLMVSGFECREVTELNNEGEDFDGISLFPHPGSTRFDGSSYVLTEHNGVRMQYIRDKNGNLAHAYLWSRDRDSLEEVRERVGFLADQKRDLESQLEDSVLGW